MKILFYFKMIFIKHLEKVIACAATGLFAVSMIQNISTISFDDKSDKDNTSNSLSIYEFMAEPNSREIEKITSLPKTEALIIKKDDKENNNEVTKKTSVTLNNDAEETKASNVYCKKTKTESNKKVNMKKTDSKKNEERESSSGNKKKSIIKKKSHKYKKTGNIIKDRLNSVELKPNKFLKGREEKILIKHLDKIIDDDMSNYEKAKACYDYIINNTYYSYGGWGNAIESVLENGFGTCTEYSYVYMAMMRYLGFNAKTVDGSTAMAAGGYGYHMWTEVKLNGTTYVFDPQVEDDMSNGKINYYRFCKTYSEVSGSYIK